MNLTEAITIRLSLEKRFLYESEAASQKKSLRAYLRERLEQCESLPYQPSINNTTPSSSNSSSNDQGILLETLLLLRYLSSPEKMILVQKELNRLNISIWKGESFSKK